MSNARVAGAESAPSVPRRRAASWTWVSDAVAVALSTVGLLVVTLRLSEANLRVPFVYNAKNVAPYVYGPDDVCYLMLIKSLIVHGSYPRNTGLGWPFGFQLYEHRPKK